MNKVLCKIKTFTKLLIFCIITLLLHKTICEVTIVPLRSNPSTFIPLQEMEKEAWVPSRFNAQSRSDDGTLILYNSFTGNMGGVPIENTDEALTLLKQGIEGPATGLAADLAAGGILVKKGTDEFQRVSFQRTDLNRPDYLHLILMPSEECNFRCTYCYETFPRGRMHDEIVEGVKNLIQSRIQKLTKLAISWFGGEPLSEPDILLEITDSFLPQIEKFDIEYQSIVTTNGYHLTAELCEQLVSRGIRTFNITLDGLQKDHDSTRILRGGAGTFDTIFTNLRALKQTSLPFKINIRNNFHPTTDIDQFLAALSQEFAGDPRFHVYFRPVGKWGGSNDDHLTVCTERDARKTMFEADKKAIEHGLPVVTLNEFLQPFGAVCYAAKPYSFVIGSDGTVYKCTVAFDSDFNRVGRLYADGYLELDYDKLALWVMGGGADEDSICQRCFFRPSCHGMACPLVRIESGKRPCPHEKTGIKEVLRVLWEQHKRFPGKNEEPTTLSYLPSVLEGR